MTYYYGFLDIDNFTTLYFIRYLLICNTNTSLIKRVDSQEWLKIHSFTESIIM